MSRKAYQRGFTLLELLVVISLAALSVGGAVSFFNSADALSTESRQHMRAAALYREAHAAVGRTLQNADIDTLTGFDVDGVATEPVFQRVTGFASGDVTHGPPTHLKWVSDFDPVPGVGEVGRVVLEPDGEPQEVVVEQVLEDSFRVRQEGRNLVVRLSIYYGTDGGERIVRTGETVVSLRN